MQTDVLIIGGGPTGLLAAALASQQNMAVCLVEQSDDPIQCNSHAHYLNAYSIEILVSAGIPHAQLVALSVDAKRAKNMVVCHRLCQTIAQINLSDEPDYQQRFAQAGRYGAHLNIPATQLHACLLELVKRLPVKILTSHRPVDLNVIQRTVMVRHCHLQSTIEIKPNYVLACDGANSATAELAGIPLRDQRRFMSFLTVECEGSIREIVEHEAMIYWIYHESMVACMVAFDLDHRQILQIPLAAHQSHEQFDEKYLRKAFSAVCGVGDQGLNYTFNIYNRWQLKTGIRTSAHKQHWLFLLGDACHQILPAGGLGLNTGFADAYNLIWKLKENQNHSSNRHWCIDTYEQERLPNATMAMNQSIENYQSFLKMSASITIGTSVRGLLTLDTMNDAWIRQQVIWLCRQYNESVNTEPQSLMQCLEEVKAHYDGTAMHHQVYYQSALILNASNRRYYQLAHIEHHPRAGMRLLNMVCVIHNEEIFIHDLLNYHQWTLLHLDDQIHAGQIVSALSPFQVKSIPVEKFHNVYDGTELTIHGLVIRPDGFVYTVIGANHNTWQSCVQSIEHLMATANENRWVEVNDDTNNHKRD